MVVAVDAETDAAWMARVRLIDDGLHIILIMDAVVFALVAFMGEADAWVGGGFDGIAEPFKLVWWDPVAFVVEFVVIAAGEMDVFAVMLKVVGIQDDEAESVFVEMIISAFHTITLKSDFVRIPVIVMVADRMIRRDFEIVIVVDVIDAFQGRVGEITAMDDEIDILPFRMGEDAVEPLP